MSAQDGVERVISVEDRIILRPAIPTTDAAYTAGDVIGGVIALPMGGTPLSLRSIVLKDDKNQKPDLQLLFFRSQPGGTYNDNAAVAPSTADMGALIGFQMVLSADWVSIKGVTKAMVQYQLDNGPVMGLAGGSLYVVIVAGDVAPDYAANSTDLTAEFGFAKGV